MALIDVTYFTGEINIPNTGQTVIAEKLEGFINKYETKILDIVLGYPLRKEFLNGYTAPTPAQKWVDMAEGVEYTLNDKPVKWQGILNKTDKESLIALYVYYWYMRDSHTTTTNSGERANKVENSEASISSWKLSRAWTELREWVCSLYEFLNAHKEVYTTSKSREQVLCELGRVNEWGI
jgi:hypothetical protein